MVAQKVNRLKFCKERRKWGIEDLRRVLFSDEFPFELFHHPNPRTDRAWDRSKDNVLPTPSVKHVLKLQFWRLMSFRASSEHHTRHEKHVVTGACYVDEILQKTLKPALRRKCENGSVQQRKLLPDMSVVLFQQDGALLIRLGWPRNDWTPSWVPSGGKKFDQATAQTCLQLKIFEQSSGRNSKKWQQQAAMKVWSRTFKLHGPKYLPMHSTL